MPVSRPATGTPRTLLVQDQPRSFASARGGTSPQEFARSAQGNVPRSPAYRPSSPNQSQSPRTVPHPAANKSPPDTAQYPPHHSSSELRWTSRSFTSSYHTVIHLKGLLSRLFPLPSILLTTRIHHPHIYSHNRAIKISR